MNIKLLTTTILIALSYAPLTKAENISHTNQLLSTNQCPLCDLSNAGLVMANLRNANLSGADLSRANLSRADLSGANLSGADLSGASLNGTNLMAANLSGANLSGVDLREANLNNANLVDAIVDTTYIQGAEGIPNHAGTPEQFQTWAIAEGARGNYQSAIRFYNQALSVKPEFAEAYLGRGVARYRLGDLAGAFQDGQVAAQLFEAQTNEPGLEASQQFLSGIEMAVNPPQNQSGGSGFKKILMSVGSLVMQFLLRGGL